MKIYTILQFIILSFLSYSGTCSPQYDNNQNIRLAHQRLFELRPVSAEKLLNTEFLNNPQNGYVTFYRLYSEVISLMIANSPSEYKKRAPALNQYIEKLKSLPDSGPDYRLLVGESKVFLGLLHVKYDSKFSGLIECLSGYNLLETNIDKYPQFKQSVKITGMIQISVSFMPKILQWGIKLLGIKGNPQAGLQMLSDFTEFAKGKPGYDEEAFIFTMAAYKIMNQEDELIKMIQAKKDFIKETALINYIAATVCVEANQAETALKLLSNIAEEKLEIPFPPLHYLTGKAKMMRLDSDADIVLLTYLHESTGTDYLKATLYELACFYYTSGNTTQYRKYIEQVKDQGREVHNRDIEAEFEANKTELPNLFLMRADFLVRGGYLINAEKELAKMAAVDLQSESEKIRYFYLEGECKRLRNLVKEAEFNYLNAVELGKNAGDYYAQKALVQAGIMMEGIGSKEEAAKYFHLCLHFKTKNNPYSDLYQNKAKAGLIRLSFPE